jgi:uncharacterized protein YicC (UPF0701 family)
MLSMTGFGAGAANDARGRMSVQIASVNHRGCQVQVRGDLRDLALDELVRAEVRTALQRGSITVQVHFHPAHSAAFGEREALAAAWRELAALAVELGAPQPALEQVAALVATRAPAAGPASGSLEDLLRRALAAALAEVLEARRREGAALTSACAAQAAALRALLPKLRSAAALRSAAYRESLIARLREILAGQAVVGEEALVRELAMHAERIDVTEELVRLAAHLDALDALLAGPDDQLGRKLEFLLQEVGREINTTGAKSNDRALTALVLEAKALVEQVKEQAANIA